MANKLITLEQASSLLLEGIEKASKETGVPVEVVAQMFSSMMARANGFPFDPLLDGGVPC